MAKDRLTRATASREQLGTAYVVTAQVLLRADAVYDLMVAPYIPVDLNAEEAPAGGVSELQSTAGYRVLNGLMLYLSLAWQVIATWRGMNTGVRLDDRHVDAALASLPVPRLKGFRDSIMHTGRVRDSREVDVMEDVDLIAEQVRAALEVLRDHLRPRLAHAARRLRATE